MSFCSIWFLVYFLSVFLLYFAFPKNKRYLCLLVASYLFYFTWNPCYAIVLFLITVLTYLGAAAGKGAYAKAGFSAAFCLVLCVLFFFKYGWLIGRDSIFFPVGISFYTLQALGYLIDVRTGAIEPEKNFAKYALFVSFFPTVQSGPIERSATLLRQIREGTDFSFEKAKSGFFWMYFGYFEKFFIADRLALVTDSFFQDYPKQTGAALVFAAILYGLQIYADFAGYSHIACGIAKVLGYEINPNFRQPYFARTIKGFWQRWHISLSGWLMDYIYIPLGGNRCKKARKYFNLFVTFLVSGLWHGAGLHYLIWGCLHSIYEIVSDLTAGFRTRVKQVCKIRSNCFSYHLFQSVLLFVMVDFAWLFFRAQSISEIVVMLKQIFFHFNFADTVSDGVLWAGQDAVRWWILVLELAAVFVIDALHEKNYSIAEWLQKQNLVFRWFCYLFLTVVLAIGTIYNYGISSSNFIYAQF